MKKHRLMRAKAHYRLLGAVGLAMSASLLTNCAKFKGTTVSISPNPLEVHADSVKYSGKVTIPPKSGFRPKSNYTGKLVIKNGGQRYEIRTINISADQYPKKQLKKEGVTLTTQGVFAFQEGMDGGMMVAENSYERKGKNFDLPDFDLAPCCITTSRLVDARPYVLFEQHTYVSKRTITMEALFQFPKNVHLIQPGEYERQSIKDIVAFFQKKFPATSITLAGYASPEGRFRRNQFLSLNRYKEVQKWLTEQMRKEGYKEYLDSTFFKVSATPQDWEGFKQNLAQTSLPENVKQQVIQVIASNMTPDAKEQKVMQLVGGAKEVEFILAPLRRTTVRLEGFSGRLSDQQIDSIANAFLSGSISQDALHNALMQEELYFATTRQTDAMRRERLLKAYTARYGQDHRSLNDLGALAIQAGRIDEAADYLNSANRLSSNNPAILNNLGLVYAARKEYAQAAQNFQASYAARPTPEAAFNLGVIYEKTAQYAAAAEAFNNAGDLPRARYNAGLSRLLMNDLAGAKVALERAVQQDPNHALAYYVLAIVGARSADNNLLVTNLRRAVQQDRSLAQKAQKDLEFRKQRESSEFKAALNP
ncbi:MAG: tetratricopeptide repeat protein [Bacteroidia bacterium]|nr:tetratricopeptide repeat protein [Bacteroidia bacterium]MDW8416829.1 tetratricopeptide repeat protein [Bacteroidia bacterium]